MRALGAAPRAADGVAGPPPAPAAGAALRHPPYAAAAAHPLHCAVCVLQGVRLIVTLECTEARTEGATPSRYTTQKVR